MSLIFLHLNSRLIKLNACISVVRDAIKILGVSEADVLSLADLKHAYHTLPSVKRVPTILWNNTLLWFKYLYLSKIRNGIECVTTIMAEFHK